MQNIIKLLLIIIISIFMFTTIATAQNNNDDNSNNNNSNQENNGENDNNNNFDDDFDEDDLFPDDDEEDDTIDEVDEDDLQDDISPEKIKDNEEYDILDIGGSLSLSIPITVGETTDDAESPFDNTYLLGTPLSSVVYFNARINETLRAYMDFELGYTPRYYDGLFTNDWVEPQFTIALDEMFLDINANYLTFFRIGKQNIKWGAGYRWSPSDFINTERKDLLEPDTERNGITGIKIWIPISTFNFISFLGLESLRDITDIALTFRAEFAYKFFEITATTKIEKGKIPVYGADLALGTTAFGGTWETWVEASYSMGSNKVFAGYDMDRKGINPTDPEFIALLSDPNVTEAEIMQYIEENAKFYKYQVLDEPFFKVVTGLTYTATNPPKWLAETFMINLEYYFNGEGYEDTELYPYAIILGVFEEVGRHYLGGSIILGEPFTIEDISINANYIMNAMDLSSMLFVSLSYSGVEDLGMSVYVKVPFGKEGSEFYLSSPFTISGLLDMLTNFTDPDVLEFFNEKDPTYEGILREILTIGIRFNVNF